VMCGVNHGLKQMGRQHAVECLSVVILSAERAFLW
jgi:hypothetical protein